MRSAKREHEIAKIDMTPMIDVVFQLLIFFIVTTKQVDMISELKVFRPAAPVIDKTPPPADELLQITVYRDGYVLQGRRVTLRELDGYLKRLAGLSKSVTVVIKCEMDSPHAYLIKLLDACAGAKLSNISVFSM